MRDDEPFYKPFLGKFVLIWMCFNFLILMMKLNHFDTNDNIAWNLLLPVWQFDKFAFWALLIGFGLYVLIHIAEFIYENLPSTKCKIIQIKEAAERLEQEKKREAEKQHREYMEKRELARVMAEARNQIDPAKLNPELDQKLLKN